jgi:uncharacterized phage protein (TIGR01671 family)
MNRPIKFRTWDKNRQSFIGPVNLLGDQKYVILPENWPWEHYCEAVNLSSSAKTINEAFKEREDYARENWIIQQYTGLKDKNGKEIYEGDILKWHEGKNNLSEVIFQNGSFMVRGINWGAFWYLSDYCDVYTCFGNIFETPELIKNNE